MDAQALLDEIERLVNRIEQLVDELYGAVRNILEQIPGWLGWVRDRLLDAWDYLCEKLQPLWDWIAKYFSKPGAPWDLQSLAGRWTSEVGSPVGGQATVADAGTLLADDVWVGVAADRYKQALAPQRAAIAAAKSALADGMSKALSGLATALWVEFGVIAGGLATLVGCIIGAIASTSTVFGAPAGPFIAAAGVVVFLTAATGAGFVLSNAATNSKLDIERALADPAFGSGKWPKAVVS